MNTLHTSSFTPSTLHTPTLETLARSYLDAVGNHDMQAVEALLAPDVTFDGPVTKLCSAAEVLEAFRRISAVHVRNEVRRVFVDDDEVCVIYDFVTDTVGSLPAVEWLRFVNGRIQAVQLYYDQLPWQALRQQLAARAVQATA